MKKINEIQYSLFKKSKTVETSRHQVEMKDFITFMREDYKNKEVFGRWSGRLANYFKPHKIDYDRVRNTMKICKTKKNPPAYFNAMLKNKWL